MLTRPRLLVVALVAALVGVGLSVAPAQAAVAKVSGVTGAGQDHYNASLKVRWKAVPGAVYQVRWGSSKTALARAVPLLSRTTSARSPFLNRCVTNYVQVRAVKGTAVGPWSEARGLRFAYQRPVAPKVGGVGIADGVRLTWPYVANATRYRVRWNAGPFGKFPGGDGVVGGSWLSQLSRSVDLTFSGAPRPGDKMMGVAYANPVFVKFDVNNACRPTAVPWTPYVPVFPGVPDPGPGDRVRAGTYNVELFPSGGSRIAGIAKNIASHNLDVVMLQEANDDTRTALLRALGSGWGAAPSERLQAQQILYRKSVFFLRGSGTFNVPNPKPGANPLVTPWARLGQVDPSDPARDQGLFVVSVHLAENPKASQLSKKATAGFHARLIMARINEFNTGDEPVVAAGDYRYLREPWGDRAGYVEAPPTMVRGGYYDAMAAQVKTGFQYSTVNGKRTQAPSKAGVATRADYLMLQGFRSSRGYTNLANWKYNGSWVSDHNLVYADLTIPYS